MPQLFNQLYTLPWLDNISVDCVFVLTKNSPQNTYEAILNQIKRDHSTFNPRLILKIFERSAINAFEIVDPASSTSHSCLATGRKI